MITFEDVTILSPTHNARLKGTTDNRPIRQTSIR